MAAKNNQCLTSAHTLMVQRSSTCKRHDGIRGSGGTATLILTLATKSKWMPLQGIEQRLLDRPSHSVMTISNELSRLLVRHWQSWTTATETRTT